MTFSGAVKLGDLNDFIALSQACVVNLGPKPRVGAVDLQVHGVASVLISCAIHRFCILARIY